MLQSYQGLLYQAIIARIQAEVPEIKWIDMEMGQLENYGPNEGQNPRPPVQFPCVLIDFPRTSFSELQGNLQWADITVELRLAFAQFSNTNAITPAQWQEQGLQYFEIEMKLAAALHGFAATYTDGTPFHSPFSRTTAVTERRQYDSINMRVRSLTFTTALEDATAVEQLTAVTAKPVISLPNS